MPWGCPASRRAGSRTAGVRCVTPTQHAARHNLTVRTLAILLGTAALAAAGCGSDDDASTARPQRSTDAATRAMQDAATSTAKGERPGTRVIARPSRFGTMLFDARRQAIYIFERDRKGRTVCYGECAKAWPPVVTRGKPVAGAGVEAALLGTVERRDGSLQVTYAGKPLYFYAHEDPGQVLCHDVNLNGGFWWAVGPNGKRRP